MKNLKKVSREQLKAIQGGELWIIRNVDLKHN